MEGEPHSRPVAFSDILCAEIDAINGRREALGRATLSGESCIGADGKVLDAVGLALSGGGVRSAAFSLGVLQALNHHNALRNVDYLSTVSGGGYIGCALSATMTCTEGKFAFGNAPTGGADQAASEIADTPSVGHLRNYSNYLIPRGGWDILTGLAIVLRGLIANAAFVLSAVLIFAAVTICFNPTRTSLGCTDVPFFNFCDLVLVDTFGYTLLLSLAGLAVFFLWALVRSLGGLGPEFQAKLPTIAAIYLVLLALVFFLELQNFFLQGMFDLAEQKPESDEATFEWLTGTVKTLAAIATPIAAVVTFFRQQMGDLLKAASADASITTNVVAALSRIAFWIAGAALPLLIWVVYLYFSYWGIINDGRYAPDDADYQFIARTNFTKVDKLEDLKGKTVGVEAGSSHDTWARRLEPEIGWTVKSFASLRRVISAVTAGDADVGLSERSVIAPIARDNPQLRLLFVSDPQVEIGRIECEYRSPAYDSEKDAGGHTPTWLIAAATWISYEVSCPWLKQLALSTGSNWLAAVFVYTVERPMILLYWLVGLALFILALLLKPNANSLHRLYRDRLSKAFLFDPRRRETAQPVDRNEASADQGRDFTQLDDMRLSEISTRHAPYHLVNAALNIQGSDYANRRGRNADFFMFSPLHVGSEATGYAKTEIFERTTRDINVASALAISGAAASSNMGSNSVAPLRPTLALLNIRLGYWLKNPRYATLPVPRRPIRNLSCFFLMREILGRLYENSNFVYLTDGGHVENLGVYELLKRRCKLIVVVDAEADISVRFPSFIMLQRYARIDLGIRIDMPWEEIRKTTCARMKFHADGDDGEAPVRSGPHAAIGCIDYGDGRSGHILYFKASLSGDENDYIRDYARRARSSRMRRPATSSSARSSSRSIARSASTWRTASCADATRSALPARPRPKRADLRRPTTRPQRRSARR